MEDVKNNSGQALGIAALITGIITFIMAVIPCVGMIAIVPGVIAIILAAVGLSQARRDSGPTGMLIAALIIAVLASMISISQYVVAGKIVQKADNLPGEIQNIIKDVQDEIEQSDVNIKIESNGDKVEISTSKDEDLKVLEDLESGNTSPDDSTSGGKK